MKKWLILIVATLAVMACGCSNDKGYDIVYKGFVPVSNPVAEDTDKNNAVVFTNQRDFEKYIYENYEKLYEELKHEKVIDFSNKDVVIKEWKGSNEEYNESVSIKSIYRKESSVVVETLKNKDEEIKAFKQSKFVEIPYVVIATIEKTEKSNNEQVGDFVPKPMLKCTKYTDEQVSALKSAGVNVKNMRVFKYKNVPENLEWIDLKIEKYEDGKMQSDRFVGIKSKTSSNGLLSFEIDGNEMVLGAGGSISKCELKKKEKTNSVSSTIIPEKELLIEEGKEITLGAMMSYDFDHIDEYNNANQILNDGQNNYKEASIGGTIFVIKVMFVRK